MVNILQKLNAGVIRQKVENKNQLTDGLIFVHKCSLCKVKITSTLFVLSAPCVWVYKHMNICVPTLGENCFISCFIGNYKLKLKLKLIYNCPPHAGYLHRMSVK